MLTKIANVARSPTVATIPTATATSIDLQVLDERWRMAIEEITQAWEVDRESVLELLLSDPALNRKRYRADLVKETWWPEFESYFANPTFQLPDKLQRLATTEIQQQAKATKSVSPHRFYDAVDLFMSESVAIDDLLNQHVVHQKKNSSTNSTNRKTRMHKAAVGWVTTIFCFKRTKPLSKIETPSYFELRVIW
ncbi:MAG: hypothetical protein R3A47_09415 [Polyangiales bacterium]